MQFLAAGEALKRLEKLKPGLLSTNFPEIDWKGAMGFRDVIAHQYFDLDAEQVLLVPGRVARLIKRHSNARIRSSEADLRAQTKTTTDDH